MILTSLLKYAIAGFNCTLYISKTGKGRQSRVPKFDDILTKVELNKPLLSEFYIYEGSVGVCPPK